MHLQHAAHYVHLTGAWVRKFCAEALLYPGCPSYCSSAGARIVYDICRTPSCMTYNQTLYLTESYLHEHFLVSTPKTPNAFSIG
jgi:hypothetical protein